MIIKTRKDRKIANQKAMIKNRDKLIGDLMKAKAELKEENLAVHNENKDLRFENEVLKRKIAELCTNTRYELLIDETKNRTTVADQSNK